MSGFEFSDTRLPLTICGKEYSIDPYGGNVLAAGEAYNSAMLHIGEVREGSIGAAIVKANLAGAEFLETLFGEEERQRIMQGRENDLLAYQEIISHIMSALLAFRAKKTAAMAELASNTARSILKDRVIQ